MTVLSYHMEAFFFLHGKNCYMDTCISVSTGAWKEKDREETVYSHLDSFLFLGLEYMNFSCMVLEKS